LLKVPCKLSLLVEIEVDSFSRVEIISAKRRDKILPNAEVKTCQLKIFLALNARIDEDKMGEASLFMVITGGQYACRRNDGVLVVPI
jgi:hypothetical protein